MIRRFWTRRPAAPPPPPPVPRPVRLSGEEYRAMLALVAACARTYTKGEEE